ncbi:MAG: B12-binding domain-containing radical SAM protein [Oscillospiraceae bacterium]|nr:B12-binding domain-containing radical SAM protein [Oscillospiraceae bacterium]
MRKVLILAVNAKYTHTSLAAWLLAGAVADQKLRDIEVDVLETHIGLGEEEIAERVVAARPDVVGASTYIWNSGMMPGLLTRLRELLPGVVVILGGPEATHNPQRLIDCADYILRGEGEETFPALLALLAAGGEVSNLSGLCFKRGGRMVANPLPEPPARLIDPYSQAFMKALDGRIAYIETSRGCPFSCAFCLSGSGGVRFFPLETAKAQLLALSKSGARTVKLVDRTFNCDRARSFELFEQVIRLDCDVCFHFEVAPDLFDAATLELLATAPPGRIQMEAGLQSFFPPALAAASRTTDLTAAAENIKTILACGNIHLHLDLIAGLPYETLSDFMDSFDAAFALKAHTLQLGFLKLLPGSELRAGGWEICAEKNPPYRITSSRWLSAGDLEILTFTERALRQTYNKGRFLGTLAYLLTASGLRPFSLFETLGRETQGHHVRLEDYAGQLYSVAVHLPGVQPEELKSAMIRDYMAMVKGVNMPGFLKIEGKNSREMTARANKRLGRAVRRGEVAILPGGKGIFVDSEHRDPVTGLYRLDEIE